MGQWLALSDKGRVESSFGQIWLELWTRGFWRGVGTAYTGSSLLKMLEIFGAASSSSMSVMPIHGSAQRYFDAKNSTKLTILGSYRKFLLDTPACANLENESILRSTWNDLWQPAPVICLFQIPDR
mmetsp:Transcript_21357/g.41448  ORF Transcript_21357/g.41448 Transcript_21357/m.41448 type:complete len:126 (+) Transcript_21357:566-943(+)